MGFIDLNGDLGRLYGSIGMAVDQPATELTIKRAQTTSADGPEQARVLKAIETFRDALNIDEHFDVKIHEAIPAHSGLGSGTQLALAVGAGMTQIAGTPQPIRSLGQLLQRGARSAIGMSSFQSGGFVIDGGRGTSEAPPPVTGRFDFPEDWRVLLVLDGSETGVHGDKELTAFANLPPLDGAASGRISRLVLMQLLPGLLERDLEAFGHAVAEIQDIIGRYFASAQGGGVWSSPAVERIVRKMADLGAVGIGQSSWGPTGFAFVNCKDAADRLYHSLVQEAKRDGVEILVVRGRNSGASIQEISSEQTTSLKLGKTK